jgi:hypothetical protein
MAFDFDDLPEDAKRAAFAKMKPGHGEDRSHRDEGDSGASGELKGEITLTTAPRPPWLESAFRDVFGDTTKELRDYLNRTRAEREARMREVEASMRQPPFRLEGRQAPFSLMNLPPPRFQEPRPLEMPGLMPSLPSPRPPWLDYWGLQSESSTETALRDLERKLRDFKTLGEFELDADLNLGQRSFEIKVKKEFGFESDVEKAADRLRRWMWQKK